MEEMEVREIQPSSLIELLVNQGLGESDGGDGGLG